MNRKISITDEKASELMQGLEIVPQESKKPKKEKLLELKTFEQLNEWLTNKGITVRYNVIKHANEFSGNIPFLDEIETQRRPTQAPRMIRSELCKDFKKPSFEEVAKYLTIIAAINKYNPVLELLNSLPEWDKKHDYINDIYNILSLPESDELSRYLIKQWLKQCFCMLYNGADNTKEPFAAEGVLVLQGSQGIGKTRFASKLGINSQFFKSGVSLNPKDRDSVMKATAYFIVELGELESTFKNSVTTLKAFITEPVDEFREPYGSSTEKYPRRTSYIATCNSSDFLIDETGNRRFFTIPVDNIKLDLLEKFDSLKLWKQVQYIVEHSEEGLEKCFRISREYNTVLTSRNSKFTKELPGEQEVRDILAKASDSRYKHYYITVEISATEWKEHYRNELKNYNASQIGKVLTRLGVPCKIYTANKKKYLLPVEQSSQSNSYCYNVS